MTRDDMCAVYVAIAMLALLWIIFIAMGIVTPIEYVDAIATYFGL